MKVQGFPPIVGAEPTRLILGSMPGVASLEADQYYAKRGNAFWRIIEALFEIPTALPYAERCERLTARGVALWDVIAQCEREGSLDGNIVEASIVPNDFQRFLDDHPTIIRIHFNGGKAEESYRRHVLPKLEGRAAELPRTRLPSTSPAHTVKFETKLEAWREIVR
ncbi:MAG: DNA-deoxyinosine glycosylase [Planctomycetes bacterium]|nr:DNA-deoxyinosine glycosylase [Planctomycetota bacterium]